MLWEDELYAVVWTDTAESAALYRRAAPGDGPAEIHRAGPRVIRAGSNADIVAFTVETRAGRRDYAILKAEDDWLAAGEALAHGPLDDLAAFVAAHSAAGPVAMAELCAFPCLW